MRRSLQLHAYWGAPPYEDTATAKSGVWSTSWDGMYDLLPSRIVDQAFISYTVVCAAKKQSLWL